MAKGTRLPEETKRDVADRLHNGENPAELAERFGISEFTVKEYGRMYGKAKKSRVKRKVTVQPVQKIPKENTGVSNGTEKDREIAFWKDAFLAEFQKNRNK